MQWELEVWLAASLLQKNDVFSYLFWGVLGAIEYTMFQCDEVHNVPVEFIAF